MKRWSKWSELAAGAAGLSVTLGLSFLIAVLLICLLSRQPLATIRWFFIGPFTNKYYLGNMLNSAVPLVFTGLGIAIAFKSSVFNLGGEGQVYSGALVTTVICLALPGANGYLGGLAALAASLTCGAVLAGLSGFFKMKWGTDELISTFLISSAVGFVVNYFITGPLDDPANNLLASYAISPQYFLAGIFPPSKLNVSAGLAVLAAAAVFFLLNYTHTGYEMRMCGLNREFSRYGGINVSTYVVLPLVLSGALHGLAGGLAILGTQHMAVKEFSFGMGWNGIAVSLIAKNNPLAIVPAAVFFLLNYTHTGYEMRMTGLNREFSRYGGINVSTYVVLPLVLSGALHGLAGGLAILGTQHMAVKEFSFGMGWNGIAVSLIAKNNPLAVVPAALFFAWLEAGAKAAMLHSDVTFEIAAIVQSVIFYLVTAQALYGALRRRRIRL